MANLRRVNDLVDTGLMATRAQKSLQVMPKALTRHGSLDPITTDGLTPATVQDDTGQYRLTARPDAAPTTG